MPMRSQKIKMAKDYILAHDVKNLDKIPYHYRMDEYEIEEKMC